LEQLQRATAEGVGRFALFPVELMEHFDMDFGFEKKALGLLPGDFKYAGPRAQAERIRSNRTSSPAKRRSGF